MGCRQRERERERESFTIIQGFQRTECISEQQDINQGRMCSVASSHLQAQRLTILVALVVLKKRHDSRPALLVCFADQFVHHKARD
jgi:hypothetical protein